MIKRVRILLFMFFACTTSIFSQTIENGKKIDVQINNSSGIGKQLLPEIKAIEPALPDVANKKITIDGKSVNPFGSMYRIPSQGLLPLFQAYPMVNKNNPTFTDFYSSQQNPIYKQFSFVGSGEKVTYLGLGQHISLNGGIRWMPSQRLFVDMGVLFKRQFYFSAPILRQDFGGVNARIQYALTDHIRLNIWGQYMVPQTSSTSLVYNSLFPHTSVGASISVDVKKNSTISVGVEYQYDNKSGKWKEDSSLSLVF